MTRTARIIVWISLAWLTMLPITAVATNELEIVFIRYSDGLDGALHGIRMQANKDGATTFEITTPSGVFDSSNVGDGFAPEQRFTDSLTNQTFANLASEISSDWTLIWDNGLATETLATISFRTFGTLLESCAASAHIGPLSHFHYETHLLFIHRSRGVSL